MKKAVLLLSFLISMSLYGQNDEFRATWVITWHYIDDDLTVEQNKARIINILENHKKANMNAVLWQVRQSGSAYYQSSYEPWGAYAGGEYPGFDPLAFVIEEAHKRGMEVHAWFNTFHIGSAAADRVVGLHPDWVCTNQAGDYMTQSYCISPGIEAAREYTLDVAMEIVNNYDIDGLHLDYIRWNEYDEDDMKSAVSTILPDGMISDEKLAKFKSAKSAAGRFIYDSYHPYSGGIPAGFSSWDDWRRDGVTQMVRLIHDSIQSVKPYVRLSVAALGKYMTGGTTGWNGYYVVFQDAALWFNEGSIDQLTPMHYHWLTGSALVTAIESDWEPNLTTGIAEGRMYTAGPGSYILDSYDCWENHPGMVTSCRTKSWMDGFQFFSYGSWADYNYWSTAGESFFSRKTRVRPVYTYEAPDPPSLSISKTDSLHYNLTVTPAETDECWYLVYRSEDEVFEADNDEIVYQTFGNTGFTCTDTYDGLQSFNGSYTYFATASNRFRNESLSSNAVNTDPVPSYAPVVTSTVPAQNEVVSIATSVIISFSKEMNTGSIIDAFSIQPDATFSYSWSEDKKSVTIAFPTNLEYSTTYQVTLSGDLTDINGKAIDGNGDGVAGDSYSFSFTTDDPDTEGPVVTQSTVANNATNIDVAQVISVTFNEKIDPATLTASQVTLKNSSNEDVSFGFALYETADDRTVITVAPSSDLASNRQYTMTISGSITDTFGNAAGDSYQIVFTTSTNKYTTKTSIDDFASLSGWLSPTYSGSTVGVIPAETSFDVNTSVGVPSSSAKGAAQLTYSWESAASTYLIREYLSPSSTQALVEFDTTYYLQVYLFGDSSYNKFRFCIDEYDGANWTDHEVSLWKYINWRGWKLVEWKLSDPDVVGSWISSNNQLTGTKFRTDSFQFTREGESSLQGDIYLDNYRIVKKTKDLTGIDDRNAEAVELISSMPNPFNNETVIRLKVPVGGRYRITTYSLSGKTMEVALDEQLTPDTYDITLGSGYAPGIYLVEARCGSVTHVIKIIKQR